MAGTILVYLAVCVFVAVSIVLKLRVVKKCGAYSVHTLLILFANSGSKAAWTFVDEIVVAL